MKTNTIIFFAICTVIITLIPCMKSSAIAQDKEAYYYRTASHHPYREYKFLRLEKEIRYAPEISLQEMAECIGATAVSRLETNGIMYSFKIINSDGKVDSFEFEYFILNSQEDAELYALDLIGGSTSIYRHVSDYDIMLGDNAWIDGNEQAVFTRDNICIWLWGTVVHQEGNDIRCAIAIDDYIKQLDKADTADDLQSPSIDNVKIVSVTEKTYHVDGEERISYRYNLAVTAHDTGSDTLYYRTSDSSLATETDGTISYSTRNKEVNCKVFVMNERHLVASKEIFN